MITKKEVQHIAELARLGINNKEIEKTQKELSSILDYIEKLTKADEGGVEVFGEASSPENKFREDEAKISSLEVVNMLMELLPDKKEGYVKVKTVLKNESGVK